MKESLVARLRSHQTLVCVLLLASSMLAAWPVAETGMHDDWSYARTAQVLAQTGHIVFNGWGAPTLGVMLLPAALFVKLFGFSYTVVRLSTMLVALASAALFHRTLVRCGISEWNASIGTMLFVASPVSLPVETGFLSDIWSQCAILVCLYCCLRALQAEDDRSISCWIVAGAIGNAILGTSRQIAWLGFLVMVPSTLFLLRHKRKPLLFGIAAVLVSLGVMRATLAWFAHKQYVLTEPLSLRRWFNLVRYPDLLTRPLLEIPMLLLPLLVIFLPMFPRARHWAQVLFCAALGGAILFAFYEGRHHHLESWLVPFMREDGDLFGVRGVYQGSPAWGVRPSAMPNWLRAVWAAATALGIASWACIYLSNRSTRKTDTAGRNLFWLLVPFSFSYAVLLLPRATRGLTIDRYLLPLIMVSMIFLLRQYQAFVGPQLPSAAVVLAGIIGLYSIATLQDAFGLYRTVAAAEQELRAAGFGRDDFDGGWEFDARTQVDAGGYIHQKGIRVPQKVLLYGHRHSGSCPISIDVWIPDVNPKFALSYDPNGCDGPTTFQPLSYTRLLPPHRVKLYIVRSSDRSGLHGSFPDYK